MESTPNYQKEEGKTLLDESHFHNITLTLCEVQRVNNHSAIETKDVTHKHEAQESFSQRERESDCTQEIRLRDSRRERQLRKRVVMVWKRKGVVW